MNKHILSPGIIALMTTPVLFPPTNMNPSPFPSLIKSITSTCDHSVLNTMADCWSRSASANKTHRPLSAFASGVDTPNANIV